MNDEIEKHARKYCAGELFIRPRDIAMHLSMNLWTVYKMAQRGQIPSYKIGKGRRFKLSEVEAALKHR